MEMIFFVLEASGDSLANNSFISSGNTSQILKMFDISGHPVSR